MTTWDVLFKYDKDGSISSMSESSASFRILQDLCTKKPAHLEGVNNITLHITKSCPCHPHISLSPVGLLT